ncbi:MAG: acetyl-CoA hydrolase/transferase family protein [Pelotomaculum sp.]|jgi:acyl-CoA hydrolase
MIDYKSQYESKRISVAEALSKIESNMSIYIGVDVAEPVAILKELHTIGERVQNVTINTVLGPENYPHLTDPKMKGHIETNPFFYGPYTRKAHSMGMVSLVPSSISTLYRDRASHRPPDMFIGVASPMDKHGFMHMSLCISQEQDALEDAGIVILEINPNVPRVMGDTAVHISQVDYIVESDRELPFDPVYEATDAQMAIGGYIASLIDDGATIQLGIGGIPDAAAKALYEKKDLGVHSEMLTPMMVDLYEAGVITGRRKNIDKNKMVCALLTVNQKVLDFVDGNSAVLMKRGTYVNDPFVIMQNDKMVAINGAINVDLTGQIFAESIGSRQYSGSGGANDFALGAHRSKGGKAIIALTSTKKKGTISTIQPWMNGGGVVTVLRQTIDYVVTEYGIAPLTGRNIRERVNNLIGIAHPDFRAELRKEAQRLELW